MAGGLEQARPQRRAPGCDPNFPNVGAPRVAIARCAERSLRVRSGLGIPGNLLGVANIEIAIEFSASFSFLNPAVFLFCLSLELLEDYLILKNEEQCMCAFSGLLSSFFISPYHLI